MLGGEGYTRSREVGDPLGSILGGKHILNISDFHSSSWAKLGHLLFLSEMSLSIWVPSPCPVGMKYCIQRPSPQLVFGCLGAEVGRGVGRSGPPKPEMIFSKGSSQGLRAEWDGTEMLGICFPF